MYIEVSEIYVCHHICLLVMLPFSQALLKQKLRGNYAETFNSIDVFSKQFSCKVTHCSSLAWPILVKWISTSKLCLLLQNDWCSIQVAAVVVVVVIVIVTVGKWRCHWLISVKFDDSHVLEQPRRIWAAASSSVSSANIKYKNNGIQLTVTTLEKIDVIQMTWYG